MTEMAEQFQIESEDLKSYEQQFNLELRTLSKDERRQRFGITESRNTVRLVMDSENSPVIIKSYKNIDAIGPKKDERAQNELNISLKLQESGFRAAPRLRSDVIAKDSAGDPSIAFVYEEQYTPYSAIRPLLINELTTDNPQTKYLNGAFEQVKELHKIVTHGDLHLDNIGLVPPGTRSENIEFVMLDFELGKPVDKMSPRARFYATTEDVANISAHILHTTTKASSYEQIPPQAKDSLKKIVVDSYYDNAEDIPLQYLEGQMEIRYNEIAKRLQ